MTQVFPCFSVFDSIHNTLADTKLLCDFSGTESFVAQFDYFLFISLRYGLRCPLLKILQGLLLVSWPAILLR